MAEFSPDTKHLSSLACSGLGLALALGLALGMAGLHWGLPSAERTRLTFGESADGELPALTREELERAWRDYPVSLPSSDERAGEHPRSAFNAIRSLHPDEYVILKGLASMSPGRGRFFHGFFGWPSLQFYAVGAALGAGRMFGAITLTHDVTFYFAHPAQMARMFVAGRALTLLMGLFAVWAFWAATLNLYGRRAAAAAAPFLAAAPLFSVNSRYMAADVPMLLWIALVLFASSKILSDGGVRWYALGGLFIGLATATRYQGALSALLVFVAHLFAEEGAFPPPAEGEPRHRAKRLLAMLLDSRLWLAGLLAPVVFFLLNPYILMMPDEFLRQLSEEFASAITPEAAALPSLLRFLNYGVGPGVALLAVAGLAIAMFRRRRADWLVFWGFVPAFLFLAASQPFMNRYWMPVLPFPILLAARCVSGDGLGCRKMSAKALRLVAAGAAVLAFVFSIAMSAAYARMHRVPDPRVRAGRWLAENVPTGVRIGIVSEAASNEEAPDPDPWQFQLPPMNPQRTPLVGLRLSPDSLEEADPDFVVVGDFQLPPLAPRGPLTAEERAFVERLQDPELYERVSFRNEPRFGRFPVILPFLEPPHDFRYADPGISIYRQTGSG